MKYQQDGGNSYFVRLDKGERLSSAIEQFAEETKIEGGWVNGLGATTEAVLGFYELSDKQYYWQTFDDLLECVSLTGNLALDEQGKIMFHLHGVFSDIKFRTFGGHVKDLVAGGTLELFITRASQPLRRKTNPATGLQNLDL